jgi:O-antigen ligase
MNKTNTLSIAALLLVILGIYMIVLGTRAGILPPTVTGIGFIIIALVFWKIK